ncbi:hypothetical protein KDH_24360 [Dictyobacter sp. S3.2.2.5]|uniref:Penicillin-binding protein transpeptidase domain-containing protein n=1 Tax=Dictyobacter halimunensis TaxID=3026934 RepID=A0ABQ6FRF0_9CHLR|nr:hypothetical protein KDH_24360 [Dictyobacter sp. S3.2.2.5]
MKPDNNSKLTATNIEEKIEQIFQSGGQSGTSASLDDTVLQDLYQTLYHGDEAIMERTWHRLAQRYPLIEQSADTAPAASDARTVITFPQPETYRPQPTPKRPPQRTKTRTLSILMLVAACLLIIGGSLILFTQYQKPTQPAAPPQKGPLQFFDRQGKLIYQVDSHNKVTVGMTPLTRDFINYSLDELAADLHVKRGDLPTMGLKVTTTLDMQLQTQAYQKAQQTIATTSQTHEIGDASAIVLDYHDGSIHALFGNLNTQQSSYNVATQHPRLLGSIFKPITYLTAFEQGISPGEIVDDAQQSFPSSDTDNTPYTPYDYGMTFSNTWMSYRTALQSNSNVPAVQILTRTKLGPLVKKAQALGLHTPPAQDTGYAAALGIFEDTVLNATTAYGTIANQGVAVTPHTIDHVNDSNGRIRYQAPHAGKRILKPGTAFMLTDILSDQQANSEIYGQCNPTLLYSTSQEQCQAAQPGNIRPAAVETGVNDNFKDTWTVGYTTDYVVGVWAGNDNARPLLKIIATDGASQIWHDTIQLAEQGLPIKQFPGPPSDVVKKTATSHGVTTTDWYLK